MDSHPARLFMHAALLPGNSGTFGSRMMSAAPGAEAKYLVRNGPLSSVLGSSNALVPGRTLQRKWVPPHLFWLVWLHLLGMRNSSQEQSAVVIAAVSESCLLSFICIARLWRWHRCVEALYSSCFAVGMLASLSLWGWPVGRCFAVSCFEQVYPENFHKQVKSISKKVTDIKFMCCLYLIEGVYPGRTLLKCLLLPTTLVTSPETSSVLMFRGWQVCI